MAIKISIESIKIPVEIGDLKFEIDVTDEKYESFINHFNVFLTKIEALDEANSEEMANLKVLIKEVYDELLGVGAYEKTYAVMPNMSFIASALANIVMQLVEEMDKRAGAVAELKKK